MPTTLFDHQPYDPVRERRKRLRLVGGLVLLLIVAVIGWTLRYWPEEHRVDRFFSALQAKNYEQAYGVWMNDPNWQQHPQQYARYTFNDFKKDWGPGGEWGIIKSHKIYGVGVPHGYSGSRFAGSSGVVVVVTVNDRIADKASLWVQKSDKTLGFSPYTAN